MSDLATVQRWSLMAFAVIASQVVLESVIGLGYREAAFEVGVILMVVLGALARRRSGKSHSRRVAVTKVVIAWGLTCLAILLAPPASARPGSAIAGHALLPLSRGSALAAAAAHPLAAWKTLTDLLIGGALLTSVLAVRVFVRPVVVARGSSAHELEAARAIVDDHGDDSLSPFILRPDKAFQFAAGGVLAYRVIGRTAVVSGDPVGPNGSVHGGLAEFLRTVSFAALAHRSLRQLSPSPRRLPEPWSADDLRR